MTWPRLFAATVTPFAADGSIDDRALDAHLAWLAERGVRGFVPFGSTGEGPSLSTAETHPRIARIVRAHPEATVIPAIYANALPDVQRSVHALAEAGCPAVLVVPPAYFKPAGETGLRRWYEAVLDGAPVPIIAYHIPKYAVHIAPGVVIGSGLWGVKDSGGDDGTYARAVLDGGKHVLMGTEDGLWARLAQGADGLVSALANVVPEVLLEVIAAAEAHDARGELAAQRLGAVRAASKRHGLATLKRAVQARTGIAMGGVRLPLVDAPPSDDGTEVLAAAALVV